MAEQATKMSFEFLNLKIFAISLLIGWISYKLVRFFLQRRRMPPGPMPLPLFGNLLNMISTKDHWSVVLAQVAAKYGPVLTFWWGKDEAVIITDIELAREVFKKNEFAGRVDFSVLKPFSDSNGSDIVFTDFSQEWESLRRVGHAAVKKYAASDKLAVLCSDIVDETVELIHKNETIDKPFDISKYINFIFWNIIATSAFCKRYSFGDPELEVIRQASDTLNNGNIWLGENIPALKMIGGVKRAYEDAIKTFKEFSVFCKIKLQERLRVFDRNDIRSFADALILAKEEGLEEGKESAAHLGDGNLSKVLVDLFLAGTDTSLSTLQWMTLLMANYPDYQLKMRAEVSSVVGNRMARQADRTNCPWINAFMFETLRFRNILPVGVPHKTVTSCTIGDYQISSGVRVDVFQQYIMNDPKNFDSPDQFRPERFLDPDSGVLLDKNPAFIPFGVGRRVCLGEKLAIADLFLVLVRLLQATDGFQLELPDGRGSANLSICVRTSVPLPNKFQVVFRRNN